MMVARLRRSVSLPRPKPGSSTGDDGASSVPADKSYHVRSSSLPCRSHPLVSQLEDEVRFTRAWQLSPSAESAGPPSSAAWLRSGLARLELLHLALDELLRLPQTGGSLCRRGRSTSSGLAERFSEELLCFVDAYGSFRSALVSVQELRSEAQVAVRRRDAARLASAARSLKEAEKELAALALVLREVTKSAADPASESRSTDDRSYAAADLEMAGILRDVKTATVSASEAVFHGTAAALSSATAAATAAAAAVAPKSTCWRDLRRRLALAPSSGNRKRISDEEAAKEREESARRASERLEALEELLVGLESGSERVYRSLMNTRVSLLNILTP